jgi:hypothetical protein
MINKDPRRVRAIYVAAFFGTKQRVRNRPRISAGPCLRSDYDLLVVSFRLLIGLLLTDLLPDHFTVHLLKQGWLDLESTALVEVTSEDNAFPIESARMQRDKGGRRESPCRFILL